MSKKKKKKNKQNTSVSEEVKTEEEIQETERRNQMTLKAAFNYEDI